MKFTIIISIIFHIITFKLYGQTAGCDLRPNKLNNVTLEQGVNIIPTLPRFAPPRGNAELYNPPVVNERVVYWLHGFGGTAHAWEKPSKAAGDSLINWLPDFKARKIVSEQLDYNTLNYNNSLHQAVEKIHSRIEPLNYYQLYVKGINPTRNFMIAHSEGGLVSRMYEKEYELQDSTTKFGGLVTFGSSHGGAKIIENAPKVNELAIEACNNLTEPIVLTFATQAVYNFNGLAPIDTFLNALVLSFVIYPLVSFASAQLRPIVCDNILPKLLNMQFQAQLKPIGQDYRPGAAALQSLANYEPADPSNRIPKVLAYGVETDNHLWRAVENMVIRPSADFNLFAATDDAILMAIADMAAAMYAASDNLINNPAILNAKDKLENGVLNGWPKRWYLKPLIENAENQATTISQGRVYLIGMNRKWLDIIGALETTIISQPRQVCICERMTDDGVIITKESKLHPCDEPGWTCEVQTKYESKLITSVKDNDCIVTNESSFQFPGMSMAIKLNKSNHLQMRNDANLKDFLNDLFNGIILDYFSTSPRF